MATVAPQGTTLEPVPPPELAEYRVTWRRESWSSRTKSKSRRFTRRADADAFVARLLCPWEDCSAAIVTISWRPVGAWRPLGGGS